MMLRGSRVAPLMMGGVAALTAVTPGWTHHPFEGVQPQDLNLLQGLVSGLGHPLLVVGLAGSGLAALLGATPEPGLGLVLELVVGLSIVAAGLVHGGFLPAWTLLPLMGVHGFLLGESMIGAEPTPLVGDCPAGAVAEVPHGHHDPAGGPGCAPDSGNPVGLSLSR